MLLAVLAALPLGCALVMIVCGVSAVQSALSSLCVAILCGLLWFHPHRAPLGATLLDYLPLVGEVLAILAAGMVLAALMDRLHLPVVSRWLESALPSRGAAVALITFGLVPLAESVTGFGVGILVGIPIFKHLGFTPVRTAFFGLAGLVAVPWGALGPGTLVAAGLTGVDVNDLGVISAWFNAVIVIVFAFSVIWALAPADRTLPNALFVLLAAASLWSAVLVTNIWLGTPLAGVIGSLFTLLLLLAVFRLLGVRPQRGAGLLQATAPYAALIAGLVLMRGIAAVAPGPVTTALGTPPLWLAVACLVAALIHPPAAPTAEAPVEPPKTSSTPPPEAPSTPPAEASSVPPPEVPSTPPAEAPVEPPRAPGTIALRALRAWVPVGVSTLAFMLLGWWMTTTGMSAALGSALATLGSGYLVVGPALSAIGAIVTGSNTGANAMFAATQGHAAARLGVDTLTMVGAANVAASGSALAAPPRLALAMTLATASTTAPPAPLRQLTRWSLGMVAAGSLLTGLALWLLAG